MLHVGVFVMRDEEKQRLGEFQIDLRVHLFFEFDNRNTTLNPAPTKSNSISPISKVDNESTTMPLITDGMAT